MVVIINIRFVKLVVTRANRQLINTYIRVLDNELLHIQG